MPVPARPAPRSEPATTGHRVRLDLAHPVEVVRADDLEPGDLILGPGLTRPTRLWWATSRAAGTVELLLPHAGHVTTVTLHPHTRHVIAARPQPVADPVSSVERARTGDICARLLAAAAGAVTLRMRSHPAAPPAATADVLLDAHAALAGTGTHASWALLCDLLDAAE